jgi:hypothetical protein
MDGEVRGEQLVGEMVVGVVRSLLGPVQELGVAVVIGEAIQMPLLEIGVEEDDREQNPVAGIETETEMVIGRTDVFRLLDANHHLREVEEAGVTDVADAIDLLVPDHAPVLELHRGGDGMIKDLFRWCSTYLISALLHFLFQFSSPNFDVFSVAKMCQMNFCYSCHLASSFSFVIVQKRVFTDKLHAFLIFWDTSPHNKGPLSSSTSYHLQKLHRSLSKVIASTQTNNTPRHIPDA